MEHSEQPFSLDPDQTRALELMLAGGNVYLGGRAGSGKSTVIEHFRELCTRRTAFLAPSGLAAININGSTIHRFFGFAAAPFPVEYRHCPEPRKREVIELVETVVIDEISMVRSDLFEALTDTLCRFPLRGCDRMPFGGRQVIVSGDFCQLPPVVCPGRESIRLMESFGGTFAFNTQAWQRACFEPVWLRQAHRQGTEREFVDALDAIRRGWHWCSEEELFRAIRWINRMAGNSREPGDCVVLCPTRRRVEEINAERDAELETPSHAFDAAIEGPFDTRICPAEEQLSLRVGSRVMLVANGGTPDGTAYANGDTGVVTRIDAAKPDIDVLLNDGRRVTVGPHRWLEQEYRRVEDPDTGEETIKLVPVAALEQIPLKLAYAITIHKSQGMTLSRVHVDLDTGAFESGQLYVALSRCRSLAGLSLERPVQTRDVILAPEVRKFHQEVLMVEIPDSWLSSSVAIDVGEYSAGTCPAIQIVY
jgi:ATP-dependent exoDNAse (exonuclease V) alpha subunit